MKFVYSISFFLFLLSSSAAIGQELDSIPTSSIADSLLVTADSLETAKEEKAWPVPKKAALWSIIPGGGQVYNKRWWKLPIVYGAMGGLVYAISYNQGIYRRMRDALDLKRMDMEHEFSGTPIDNEQSLLSLRDQYDKNTQLSYIGLTFVYLLQSMEAYVDAHLRNFDIDEDLSMELKLKPSAEMNMALGQPVLGIGLKLTFDKPQEQKPKDFLLGR